MGIYLRGKSWYYDFMHKGVRYAGSVGPVSRTIAKEEFARKKAAAVEGRLNPLRPRKSPLFKEFAEGFINHKRAVLRSTSAARIEYALKPLRQRFALKRLNNISTFEIEKYRRDRKDKGRTDATINRELQTLRHLFNKALAWEEVEHNPMRGVKLKREENARVRFLTREEEDRLLEACGESLRAIVTAALNTGFRRSELLSLTWPDVDFDRGLITVQAAYAKNGERRSIPINRELRWVLEQLKAKAGDSTQVFLNTFGKPYKLVSTVFDEAVERAGMEDFHFHDLRHTFASRLVMAGVDLRTVQVLMAHKTINMTLRYSHLAPDHLKKAIESLNRQKTPINFHNTPALQRLEEGAKSLIYKNRRRKVSGGAAGLQNQSGDRKVPGGFDSLPSPPPSYSLKNLFAFSPRTALFSSSVRSLRSAISSISCLAAGRSTSWG